MKRHLLSATAVLVMAFLALGSVDSTATHSGGTGGAESGATGGSVAGVGETFRFKEEVFAGATYDDLERITQLSVAKDETGLRQMMAEGRLATVPAGTEAKVIDLGFLGSEVRILSGPLEGESVWVASDFVRK